MGKGDIKTAKGKRVRGSHGKTRPRKTSTTSMSATLKAKKAKGESNAVKPAEKKAATKKTTAKKAATKKESSESAE